MADIIFVKEILSSRSPKLRLLCRLTITRYRLLFFNHTWYIPFRKHQKESYNSWHEFRLTHLLRWSIDYYSWQVLGINFEVTEKRFTKESRAQLAISDFDIQLTWKDPENSNGIRGNLKRQLLDTLFILVSKSYVVLIFSLVFQRSNKIGKKWRMESGWNRLDQTSLQMIEKLFKTSITPTKVISCLKLPCFDRSASCENIVASVPDPVSLIRPGKHGDLK